MIFQKNYRTVGWPNFSQIGSRVADLGFKTYPQQADYNTKAVNVDAYQRRDNNSDTAGKVENETRQQMNNLFQRLCSVRSFLLSRKLHQLFATGSFHFRTAPDKQVEPSPLLLDIFFKSSTLPWKNRQQTAFRSFS